MSRKRTNHAPTWSALFEFPDGRRVSTGRFSAPEHADTFGSHYAGHAEYLGAVTHYRSEEFGRELARAALAADGQEFNDDQRTGIVTRWHDDAPWGFIADNQGRAWFVSSHQLPEGTDRLTVGTRVSFSGVAEAPPNHRHPNALDVQPEQAETLAPVFIDAAKAPTTKGGTDA